MRNSKTISLSLILLITIARWGSVNAQIMSNIKADSTTIYIIELADETKLIGNILQKDSLTITLKTANIQSMQILIENIVDINQATSTNFKDGVYWFPNPFSTRYFFTTSAYRLKTGEGYYQNTMLSFNSFNFGITNNFSLTAGFELISLSLGEPIFLLSPKVGFDIAKNVNTAAGVLMVKVPDNFMGIVYGVTTFGNEDNNISTGLGWGFLNDEFSKMPILNIAAMTRIGRRVSLVTENWIIPADGYYPIFSYGIRFFGDKISVDLAFINNKDIASELPIGFPLVDFVVKF